MALSGLQIFQLLPRTNCKECGYPTCLAFAMKLATMAESIGKCPDASDAVKAALGAAAEPPIRTLKVGPEAAALSLGGETVCFRHEKTFVNRPAFAIGVQDVAEPAALTAELKRLAGFQIQRIGEELGVDMVWLRAAGGDFVAAAQVLRDGWPGAVVLDSPDTEALRSAADLLRDRRPVLFGATSENLDVLSKAALETGGALVVSASCAKALAPLTERANAAGLKDLLLHVDERSGARAMAEHTIIRRAALRKRFRPLGYPVIARIPEGVPDPALDAVLAVCKYASVILLPAFDEAMYYPLLTLRQSIYTDPQKPIQVDSGVYSIGSPEPDSPVFLTTNFSLTYFLVSGEIENSGTSAHLVVHDCDGMSVLTAWAAGKFTGARVAEFIRASDLPGKESGRTVVIPGQAAVISGELEEGLPGFKVLVGPPEAADIPSYVKYLLQ